MRAEGLMFFCPYYNSVLRKESDRVEKLVLVCIAVAAAMFGGWMMKRLDEFLADNQNRIAEERKRAVSAAVQNKLH